MATPKPFRVTPSFGPDLYQVIKKDKVFYEGPGRGASGAGQVASPQTGVTCAGSDGREYIWVEASGAITVGSSETQVTLTQANGKTTAAAGAGGFYVPVTTPSYTGGNIAAGDHFWAAKGTTPLA